MKAWKQLDIITLICISYRIQMFDDVLPCFHLNKHFEILLQNSRLTNCWKRISGCKFIFLMLLYFYLNTFRCSNSSNPLIKTSFLFLFLCFSPAGTIFLFFTLNAFCSFYMLSLKTFTIFQLIEKANWIFLSAFGIFSLCFSTETTNKAITDCTTLLNTMYSHDACENINHQVEVCWKPWNRFCTIWC